MSETTTIFSVLKENGHNALCPNHPDSPLFEIQQGDHKGKRGCRECLYSLVGPTYWNPRYCSIYETGKISDAWMLLYEAFEKKGSKAFEGDYVQTVVMSKMSGKVLGHLWAWGNPAVVDEWNPKENGFYGEVWKQARPKGWRVCRNQEQVLDWAIGALSEW